MTGPDQLISAQRERVLEARRTLDIEMSKLAGMEEMALAVGPPNKKMGARESSTSAKPGGRQPGSITRSWRRILGAIYMIESEWFNANTVVTMVKSMEERDIRASEVRRIFKGYIEHGYIEQDEHGLFRITHDAVTKFELDQEPRPSTGLNETEAPEAELPSAPVSDWGVQPPQSFQVKPNPWPAA